MGLEYGSGTVSYTHLDVYKRQRVDNCAEALASMVAAGATPIDKEPRPGSRGTTVAFIHPKGSFGTLIELVQE